MALERHPVDRVCEALRRPQGLETLSLPDWELLVRQARHASLLARVGCILEAQDSIDAVPHAPRMHLKAAVRVTEAQHAEALRELANIETALAPIGVQPVLLKGSAYVAAGLLPAMGRTFNDIDMMVPRHKLGEIEAALMSHGWTTTHHSAYDQRHYRRWLHKLPPLRHIRRGTVIDLHHAILPDTARLKPNAAKLLANARPIAEWRQFAVLDAPDMVLQSMVDLFHDDDLSHSLRDLSDLDLLLRHLGRVPAFWADLVARARELHLARPLNYGLRYTHLCLGTPVPPDIVQAMRADAPGPILGRLSDALWARALRSQHQTAADRWTAAALFALHVRAHWLHLPPLILLRHLTVEALGLNEAPVTAA